MAEVHPAAVVHTHLAALQAVVAQGHPAVVRHQVVGQDNPITAAAGHHSMGAELQAV
jgi:hypothetical protein